MLGALMHDAATPLPPGRFFGVNCSERKVGGASGLVLSETVYQPGQRVPRHAHERAYFGYTVGGGYREQLGRRGEVTFHPRSLVFHPTREVQYGDISDRGARLLHIEPPDAWFERLREYGEVPDLALDHRRGPMVALARTIYRELCAPDAASPMVIEGVVLELLGGLLRARTSVAAGGVRGGRDGAGSRWLSRARELLHARALSGPSLAEVADEIGVAPVRLARAFRRAYGESPGDFVRRERIRIACERICAGDVELAALAVELGFYDQSHFTRTFRRQLGVTPAAWQRAHATRR